ncbi:MAG TPA: hypothetical protein VN811_13390 [Thermoanaerobaculia bacterium]|nr:hypothetical protein [Thermoanaerobaculia bacterium]HXT52032.1 hypothetical protein [Thermoanaerobaculia bacterium]
MVQPQSVPPQKKGLSVWAWVAIGCVGVIVVCGVAFGAFAWWGYNKAKTAVAEYKDNPGMATVKMITAMNPDLELVSSDEATGKVTIKNKKTGEVVTVNMADIRNGKISFDTPQGESSMSFDSSGGKMEVHGANGETATYGGSAQLPGWVPAYPGATPEGVYAAEDSSQRGGTFSLATGDSVDDVFGYYKSQLEGAGFKVTESKYSGPSGDGGMVIGESGDGKRTVTFTLSADAGKTRVSGVYSEKKS